MPKIINIDKNYDLGEILAEIKSVEDSKIILQVTSQSNFLNEKKDLSIINNFAKLNNKSINIQDTQRLEKLGFASGKDVNMVEHTKTIKSENTDQTTTMSKKGNLKISMPRIFKKHSVIIPIIISIIFLLITIGIAGAGYYYLPKAEIKLAIEAQVFTGTKEVIADTEKQTVDVQSKTIPATRIVTTIEEDQIEIPTGEKETGNKATGTIEILNKTDEDIEVKKGSIVYIEDDEKLEYITDESIKIPAKTTEEVTTSNGETKQAEVFGSKKVGITANTFGEKYNVDDEAKVSFKDFESKELSGKIDEEPRGGSTKKVTVVTQKDQDALKEKVEKAAKKKALDTIKSKTIGSQKLLEDAIVYKIVSETFDTKIEEETDKFSLTIQMQAEALVFENEHLREVLEATIKEIVPKNFQVNENKDDYNIVSTVKQKNYTADNTQIASMNITNKIQSYVVPEINLEDIKNNLTGLQIIQAEEYLAKLPNISEAEIKLSTASLPSPFNRLPQRAENISIYLSTK